MFNLKMFKELQPQQKKQTDLYKTYKLSDFPANKKRVCTLAWNKSGSKLISGSQDSVIKMFSLDGPTLTKLQDFKGHSDQVESLVWHPYNDSVFVSTSGDKSIRIWDSKQSKQLRSEKTKDDNLNLAFSPDGNIIGVSNVKEELSFYDTRMWKVLKQMKFKNEVNDFQWDKSGHALLVADSSGSISLFNGQTLASQPLVVMSDYHYSPCNTISVESNNRYFVTGGNDSLIGVWDLCELMVTKTISNNDFKVIALNISQDGQFIGSICEDDINKKYFVEIYDSEVGNTMYSYSSSYGKFCIQWHPKKNILAFAGEDKNEGVIHLLQPAAN